MKFTTRRRPIRNLGLILGLSLTLAQCLCAQTPTLVRSAAHVGIASNFFDSASTYTFQMEPNGSPRGVTAGDTIIFFGTWPSGRPQTFTDNTGANTWNASFSPASSCQDSAGSQHGFFYASNVSAGTSLVTESSSGTFQDTVMDFAYFANMATSGAADGSSCASAVHPANNTAPNITGTPFTTTANGDLIITCVYDIAHPLGAPNNWNSITYPANFTGLSEEVRFGHACAYWVQPTAGSFTPTFTVSQSTHDTFVIISAAFKAGTGGSLPGPGPSPVISEMAYVSDSGTMTVNLPCPAGTTNITVMNEVGNGGANIGSVTDSAGNTYSHPTFQSFFNEIFYANSPAVTGNSFTVNLNASTGNGIDLIGLFCTVGTSGIDTGLQPANGSMLTGPGQGAAWSNSTITGLVLPSDSSGVPSEDGDLFYDAGTFGTGPTLGCVIGSCVYDYVGSQAWSGSRNGDNQTYSNGDFMGHYYDATTAAASFNYNLGTGTSSSASSVMLALKSASASSSLPAPPTNLQAVVH